MRQPIPSFLIAISCAAFCTVMLGCGDSTNGSSKGPMEKTGEAVDKAAEKTGEVIKEGAQKTGEAVEKAGEKVKDAAK